MHSLRAHEGSWNSSQPYWIFSPWMTTLLVDAMQRYYEHSGDSRVLESAQRFADAVINDALGNRDFGGDIGRIRVPAYISGGSAGNGENNRDYEHALDVAKVTAFAYHASVLQGSPNQEYLDETLALLRGARSVFESQISESNAAEGRAVYPISPERKAGWWFRTTYDLDYLINYDGQQFAEEETVNEPDEITADRGRTAVQGGSRGYVNPAAGETAKIHFKAEGPGAVDFKIFSQRGQIVWEGSKQTDGERDYIEWDTLNNMETDVASGVYIVLIEGPGIHMTRKIAVVR